MKKKKVYVIFPLPDPKKFNLNHSGTCKLVNNFHFFFVMTYLMNSHLILTHLVTSMTVMSQSLFQGKVELSMTKCVSLSSFIHNTAQKNSPKT